MHGIAIIAEKEVKPLSVIATAFTVSMSTKELS